MAPALSAAFMCGQVIAQVQWSETKEELEKLFARFVSDVVSKRASALHGTTDFVGARGNFNFYWIYGASRIVVGSCRWEAGARCPRRETS